MVQEEGCITIEQPVNVVFDFLLDGMNNRLWRTAVTDVEPVAGRPHSYKQGMKGPTGRVDVDYEVINIEPNVSFEMNQTTGMIRPSSSFRFEAVGNATRVTLRFFYDGKGPAKMMEPLVVTVMRREIGMLPNLKACLEQTGAP